jgi:SPX domain protein involved in polyphosphate accumulation
MKFGKQLQDLRREGWLEYYVDYKHVKKVIKQLKSEMGSAAPSDTLRSFLDVLMEQLDKVNAFFLKEEAALTAEWQTVDLSVPESLTEQQKKLLMRWLKFRLRTASGNTVTYRSSSSNSFTTFCEVYEKVQGLRQFVATNYIGFVKSMKKFEKKTGLRVAHSFMPRLQRSKFFLSACLAILLTEVDCAAKDLLHRLGFQGSSELNHEFCCSCPGPFGAFKQPERFPQ